MIFQQGHLLALKGEEEGGEVYNKPYPAYPYDTLLYCAEHWKAASGAIVMCARQCSARIQQRWWWGNIIN